MLRLFAATVCFLLLAEGTKAHAFFFPGRQAAFNRGFNQGARAQANFQFNTGVAGRAFAFHNVGFQARAFAPHYNVGRAFFPGYAALAFNAYAPTQAYFAPAAQVYVPPAALPLVQAAPLAYAPSYAPAYAPGCGLAAAAAAPYYAPAYSYGYTPAFAPVPYYGGYGGCGAAALGLRY